jgi:hypothetical protein
MAEPSFEQIVDGIRHGWQSIDTYVMPTEDEQWKGVPSVLVDNGEQVGEAELKSDWGRWDSEDDESDQPPLSWAWTHHSTCSCCHSFMEPQPKWWQPMPSPAQRKAP